MPEKKIMLVGFNPALQKVLNFSDFRQNEVNRAEKITYTHGGKAANYAKALDLFGFNATIFQFTGGNSGKKYCDILSEEGIDYRNCITEAETRICSTCISEKDQSVTEIIEPSENISSEEAAMMKEMIDKSMKHFDAVCICGTFPPGVDNSLYAAVVKKAVSLNIPVLIDAYIDINPVLQEGPDFLKINLDEFRKIISESEIRTAAANFFKTFNNVKVLALTDGPDNAYLFINPDIYSSDAECKGIRYYIPELEKVVNPIGAGDTAGAGFISSVLNGASFKDAFKKGLAAASASCLEKKNANFDVKYSDRFFEAITTELLN